jgi:hypothetical protein
MAMVSPSKMETTRPVKSAKDVEGAEQEQHDANGQALH